MVYIDVGVDRIVQFNTYQVCKIINTFHNFIDVHQPNCAVDVLFANCRKKLLADYNVRMVIKSLMIDHSVKDGSGAVVARTTKDGDFYGNGYSITFDLVYNISLFNVKITGCIRVVKKKNVKRICK